MSRLLVCPPDYFDIEYEINPWMRRSNTVDHAGALAADRGARAGRLVGGRG